MEITKDQLQVGIAVVQLIGLPLLFWMVRMLIRIHRSNKLTQIKTDALVEALSPRFGNGEFKKDFTEATKKKMEEYNFVNKDK